MLFLTMTMTMTSTVEFPVAFRPLFVVNVPPERHVEDDELLAARPLFTANESPIVPGTTTQATLRRMLFIPFQLFDEVDTAIIDEVDVVYSDVSQDGLIASGDESDSNADDDENNDDIPPLEDVD